SRLFIEVRERRGLCYYISTGRELYSDVGNIVTQAGVTTNLEKIKEGIKVIIAEHQKMSNGDINNDEFVRAKELIKGRLLLSLEDSSQVASFYGTKMLLEREIKSVEDILSQIEKVTKEEITQVASDVFQPQRLNITLIGPVKQEELTVKDIV
ncbi:MAG TPA: insulinase family protein, partial [Candidatus Nitrosocosmicus sp.]|nr:insulinase family protein [Candidatus Nitrosocosmicus sp.]